MQKEKFIPTKLSLLSILLASMITLMGGAAVAPALPMISEVFSDYDEIWVNMIITLPSLAVAVTGLLIGLLADKVGKVKILLISLIIFTISGISGYFLNNLYIILVGRFFVGVGIAGITSCCTALVSSYYYGEVRVKILSMQTAAMGVGVLFLETGGGALAGIGWHEPFLIYGIGLLIFMISIISLKEPTISDFRSPTDLPEKKSNVKIIILCYMTIFLLMLEMFVVPTKLPTYMTDTLGDTALISGLILGVNGTFNAISCLMYRRISLLMDRYQTVIAGFLLLGLGYILFLLPASYPQIIFSSILLGVGVGMATTSVVNILSENASFKTSGRIMGGYSMFLNLGQFMSTLLIAFMLSINDVLQDVFIILGIVSFVIAVVYVPLRAWAVRSDAHINASVGN